MSTMNAVYVVIDGKICTGRGLKSLCEKLNKIGHNDPNTEFDVYTFYEQKWITRIKCVGEGAWIKFVPEHWATAYRPKRNPIPQIRRAEE